MAEPNYTVLPEDIRNFADPNGRELIFDLQDELDKLLAQSEALSCAFSQMKFTEFSDEIGQLCMSVVNEQLHRAQDINKQLWAYYISFLSAIE